MRRRFRCFFVFFIAQLICQALYADTVLRVAVSSNFAAALNHIKAGFEAHHDVEVQAIIGASGVLATQLSHGAPYDIFLSADHTYIERLQQSGKLQSEGATCYARGILVLVTPSGARPDSAAPTISALAQQSLSVSIAAPEIAPYGQAAQRVIERIKPREWRVINAHSVGQAYQHFSTGNVSASFVAKSQLQPDDDALVIDSSWYEPLDQWAAISATSTNRDLAVAFLRFLQQPNIQQMVMSLGYGSCDES